MTLWAKGLDFKNKANSTRVGGVGVYGQDGQAQKVYLGLGHEPWNNQGLEMTSSTIKFKGNDIYHVGRKPSPAEIGAADRNHNHNDLYYLKNEVDNKVNERAGHGLLSSPTIYKRFYVDGDANTYYPVLINLGQASFGFYNVNISRGYNWEAPNSWNDNTHRGGLTLSIEWTGDNSWGGNCKTYRVRNFDETYSTMVAGMQLSVNGMVVWLRGGHALYQIDTETGASVTAVVHLNGYTASDKQVYSARTNRDRVVEEIKTRENLRNGGAVYDGNQRVYSPINKPSPNDINAVNKSGDTMTGHLTVNGFTNSSNYIRLAGGNNNVLGAGTGADDVFVCNDKTQKFLQLKNDGRLCYANHEIYHQGRKPSPSEIGAVSKSGDTINGNLTIANNGVLNAGNISLRGRDITINGKRALVGYSQDDGNLLIINFDKDYGAGVVIKGNVHVQQGALKADNGLDAKLNSIEIPAGHNLNDYQTPGMYYCPSDANASKIGNVPVGCAFSLLVEAHAGRKQTFTCYWKDNPKTYVRNFYMGQWGAWLIQCDGLTGPNGVSWVDKTNYWNKVPFVGSDGVMEVGKYIDFHNSDRDSKDFQVRLEAGTDGKLYCYPGFVGDDFYANKYIRIRDWYGAATDGKIYFKNDGRIMATEDVSTFQCNKFKALEGGITSDGQIYAYRNDVVADRNLIFGGRAISTLQSGESNLFAEGRQSAHGYGWHFANLNGQYSDIYAKIYHQQSDARTKIEIPKTLSLPENNESVLNKISKVTPKEFYYSEDKNKKIIYGFFAQELESQFPLAVNTSQYSKEDIESGNIIFPKDKNGEDIHDLKSIDPVAISAIMWDALKEVNVALEMQRIKNKELLDRIKVLEEKNK